MLLALFAPWAANAQTVTIGTGTDTQYESPMDNYYNYSFVEMIYTADEIAAGHPTENTILSVGFHLASEGLNNKTYTITVYMKNIDATSFESASHVAFASTDAVTTKNVTATASGWVTVELDTPFTYDPTKSLLIGVNKTAGEYAGSSYKWSYTTTTEYRHLRNHQDTPAAYDPTTPPTYPTRDYKRPNVQLTFGVPPTCFAPQNLTCTEYTATSATLTWQRHASGTENAWVLQYSTDNTFATGVQSVNVSSTPSKELTGLTAEQTYYARVRPDCDENLWSDVCEFKPSAAVCDQIGTGTETAYLVYTSYGCTYSQHIYSADELTDMGFAAGDIVSVSFHYSGTSSTYQKTQSIYMGTTTKSSYSGGNASDFESDVTLVYGPTLLSYVAGWREYELTEPFEWDGISNIVVGMLTNSTQTSSNGWSAYGTSTSPDYRTIYRYRDSTPIDITDLASVGNGTRSTTRPNINLCIIPTSTPKPRNLAVSDITASQATVSWEAPATGTPTGYQFQIKVSGEEWPTSWINAENNLSVEPTGLTASTDYVVRVRAIYAEGESGSIETEFRTLDACAFPTNFTATTVPGVGTDANFSWVKGYDETAWVLQIATDADFTMGVVEFTEGFVVDGNNVTFHATTLTPEQTYYAHVKANCGGGSTSTWSNVATFTPSNYVDYTYGANASTTSSCIPFYGSYANDARTISQYIIPATELADVAGGTVRSLTYYTNSTPNWGTATVKVYVKEVDYTTFAASSAEAVEDWETMTQVYNGSLTVSNGQMTITFDDTYFYGGGNLMIGIKMDQTGTSASVSWSSIYNSSAYTGLYAYYSTSYYSTGMSYNRSNYYPKTTINYSCTFETTSAHIAWTVTGATPTGYQYQYKSASATEWPTAWTSATTAAADLSGLTPGSSYDFRVKALYDGGNESFAVDYSFFTECTAVTAFPWKEDFEAYSTGDFSHPCWVNEHISGDGSSIFKVYTTTTGSNTTHQLQLPDQSDGTLTKLRLPEMTLPNNGYQFVIDVYRSSSYDTKTGEGIRVYASTNGEIDGATELAFIPRLYSVASGIIPAEATGNAWYTYELPIGMSGTCYIILRGENQYGTSTYMDNLTVEQIPTCARPEGLAYSDVTNHSATIEWTAGDAEQTLWQIAYSKTNFDPNTANFDVTTVSTIDATAHPFTLDKILDPESTYYVYVRANCGTAADPDFGPWNRKGISFTTQVATPAPSNFVATNPASEKVDMTWNAGGGDFESWELYYVASETAPEAPTASTTATVSNITTLPTTEAPYVLEGLNPVTKYFAWIRAKHVWNNEATYSDWVALTGSHFETLDACPTPTDLVATNLTSVSADLSWVGSDDVDSYTVQYRTAAGVTSVFTETFDNTAFPTDWARYNTLLTDEVLSGSTTLTANSGGWNNSSYGLGEYNWKVNLWNTSVKYWMVTPSIAVETGNVLTFDAALTAYNSNNAPDAAKMPNEYSKFVVLISDDNMATWSILREWNNSGSSYVLNNISNTGTSATIDLSTFANKNVKIAFYCEQTVSGPDCDLHIDNVTVGTPTTTGDWIDATTNVEEQSFQLTGLTAGTKYDVHVKSNCTSGEYCEPISFTTLAAGNMVFTNATNDGKWGNSDNWAPAQLPVSTDEVILRANATIENTCVAEAKKINLNSNTLTIADGGQLITNTAVNATVQKAITGHNGENGGWYFIASPINGSSYSATSTGLNLITDTYGATIPEGQSATYDLYNFSQNPTLDENGVGNEWRNYRKSTFSLANGKGYLYASLNGTTLNFSGNIKALPTTASQAVSLTYASESSTQ